MPSEKSKRKVCFDLLNYKLEKNRKLYDDLKILNITTEPNSLILNVAYVVKSFSLDQRLFFLSFFSGLFAFVIEDFFLMFNITYGMVHPRTLAIQDEHPGDGPWAGHTRKVPLALR